MTDSKFHAWHWPDHCISKRESRRLREEHNELFNSHHELLEALEMAQATICRLKPPQPFDSTQGTRDVIATAIAKAKGEAQ